MSLVQNTDPQFNTRRAKTGHRGDIIYFQVQVISKIFKNISRTSASLFYFFSLFQTHLLLMQLHCGHARNTVKHAAQWPMKHNKRRCMRLHGKENFTIHSEIFPTSACVTALFWYGKALVNVNDNGKSNWTCHFRLPPSGKSIWEKSRLVNAEVLQYKPP